MQKASQSSLPSLLDALALLCGLFWGPNQTACQELAGAAARQTLEGMAEMLPGPGAQAARDLARGLSSFADPEHLCAELEPTYVRLFVSSRGGVPAPLYHSHYESPEGLLMGRPAEMMSHRLAQAGLDPAQAGGEPPDHLAVELEYLCLLLERAEPGQDPSALLRAAQFAGQEMLPWVRQLQERLSTAPHSGIYRSAALLLVALLEQVAASQSLAVPAPD